MEKEGGRQQEEQIEQQVTERHREGETHRKDRRKEQEKDACEVRRNRGIERYRRQWVR